MIFRAVFSLWALVLLSACAALAPRDAGPRAEPFDVLGRVLVSYDGRSFSSNVRWWHGAVHDEIWLMTPSGQTLAHLWEDGAGATITGADQTKYRGANVESLTRQALGWEFPLARLQHWVRGMPVPEVAADSAERDGAGRITTMMQNGWRIRCDYNTATAENKGQENLPRRVEITGSTQNIRLVIDSWRRESASAENAQGTQSPP